MTLLPGPSPTTPQPDSPAPHALTLRGAAWGIRHCVIHAVAERVRLPWWLGNVQERVVFYAGTAAIGSFVLAIAKAALLVNSPSLFLLANVLFTLGISAAKGVVVVRYRRVPRAHTGRGVLHHPTAVIAGILLATVSAVYVALCLPLLIGDKGTPYFDQAAAIGLAAIAFVEFGIALTGTLRASRKQPVLVITRTINLANALVMIALAQAALLSFSATGDYATGLGITSTAFGTASALLGVVLVWRFRPVGRARIGSTDDR